VDKVPQPSRYYDISDYARPVALRIVRWLLPTPITSLQVTLAFIVVGLVAAYLFAVGSREAQIAAGLLLIVKSGIDAVDGALARARNRPSRVGRFADTLGDLLVNTCLFAGIIWAEYQRGADFGATLLLGIVALAAMTWQATVGNYFSVRYRIQTSGDTTSRIRETEADAYPWDNARVLAILLFIYQFIYAWQDRLIAALDQRILAGRRPMLASKAFMTATTVFGLGTQLAIITLFALIGRPVLAFWAFVGPLNAYWIFLLWLRARDSVEG